MVAVMIGIDPHKGSHTAVAIGAGEQPLGKLRVRASASQAECLLGWAAAWPERTWAVEGAGGLGHLLAQQLVAAGERVLDVPPKLAARVRLLQAGDTNKNDPNDALSVAIAALRSKTRREVAADDYAAVLKVWAKRHRDLSRARNQVACRLHAVLCELVPGGFSKEITAGQAALVLAAVAPAGAVAQARCKLAGQFLEDLRNLDAQLRLTKKKLAAVVGASRTTLTQIFGVGPVIAGTVIGDVGDILRFASRDHFAAYNGTAPIEVSSGGRITYRLSLRGNRRVNHAIHMAAVTQIRNWHSDGRTYYDRKIAEGKTHKEALRSLKRRISDAIYARLQADARQAAAVSAKGPGGQPGNDSDSSAAGSHPGHQLFGQATPGPTASLRPPPGTSPPGHRNRGQRRPAKPLTAKRTRSGRLMSPHRSWAHFGAAAPDGSPGSPGRFTRFRRARMRNASTRRRGRPRPRPAFVLKRGRPEGTPASSRGGARWGLAGGAGITGAHADFHLRDLQVLVELDGDQRAAGLGHVHLVRAVTGVGLDPVDGATRNSLERRRTERRGCRARYGLLVGTDRLGAAGSRRPRVTAARGRRGAAACRGSTRGCAQRAGEDATADDARSQQTHGTCPPFLAPAGVRRVGHGVISFLPWPPTWRPWHQRASATCPLRQNGLCPAYDHFL